MLQRATQIKRASGPVGSRVGQAAAVASQTPGAHLAGRLRAQRTQIVEAIFARISGHGFDTAGSTDIEYMSGLRAAVIASVDHALNGIEAEEDQVLSVPAAALLQARRAARLGIGLDTVLRRYIAGWAVLEDAVIQEGECMRLFGQTSASRAAVKAVAALLDGFMLEVTCAYTDEAQTLLSPAARDEHGADAGSLPGSQPGAGPMLGSQPDASHLGSSVTHVPVHAASDRQRARLLQATVEIVAEHGYAGATVGGVCARAKASRRTFYRSFDGIDSAVVAILQQTFERIGPLASLAFDKQACWRDGMRTALGAVLSFFDSEPELARVCLVETLGSDRTVLEHRARLVASFRALVVSRIEDEVPQATSLAADGMLAAVMGIVYMRLVARERAPLVELLGALMGTIVRPFAASEEMVAEEVRRGEALARAIQLGETPLTGPVGTASGCPAEDPVPGVSLKAPGGRRTRECLLFLSDHPGACNREIASGIGVSHMSQVSRLLSAMERHGLIAKRSEGVGKRNAWSLTAQGRRLHRQLTLEGQREFPSGVNS